MSTEAVQLPAANAFQLRRLAAFLAASLMLHALVIAGLPGIEHNVATSPITVLEVTLVSSPPLPVASDKLLQPPFVKKVAARKARSDSTIVRPNPDSLEGVFTVAPSLLPETTPVAPEPKAKMAGTTATPVNFSVMYLNNPVPAYPLSSRRAGEQGTVTVRVLVKSDGLPSSVEIEKSSGFRQLDMAARDAVRAWRFVPATLGMDPVESWVLVPVVFRLEGSS